jgi:predicted RNase H-like nuclease (RuvC/YqgF family)
MWETIDKLLALVVAIATGTAGYFIRVMVSSARAAKLRAEARLVDAEADKIKAGTRQITAEGENKPPPTALNIDEREKIFLTNIDFLVSNLKEEIEQAGERRDALEEQIEKLQKENEKLRVALAQIERDFLILNRKYQKLKEELEEAKRLRDIR